MKDIIYEIDKILKINLQKDVEIFLNDKHFKSGKFILFEHHYFSFIFYFKNKNKNFSFKIPFPFNFINKDNELKLDYKISSFTNNDNELDEIIKKIKIENKSKFYDNIIKIKFLEI